jgi:hypothetical protein
MSESEEPGQSTPAVDSQGSPTLVRESIWEVYFPTNVNEHKRAVPLASFPMIIYFWPSIFMFLICGILQSIGVEPTTLGWWATASLSFNLLVIVTDLSQKKFLIAVLLIAVIGLLLYISGQKEMGIVSSLGTTIGSMKMTYSTHVYFFISGLLSFLLFLGLLQPRLDYWLFEPNEFTHYIQPWGRDQSIPRLGSTVTREVPDVLELFLTFGGGSIVVRRENQVVARIQHVPFLGRRMKSIERMLGVTRVQSVS